MSERKQLAFDYGLACSQREAAHRSGDSVAWRRLQGECFQLWQRMVDAGMFEDEDGTKLKREYASARSDGIYRGAVRADVFGRVQIDVAQNGSE